MRIVHRMMAAIAAIMFAKPSMRVQEASMSSLPGTGPGLFNHHHTDYGSGLNYSLIEHARRNNRRGKIVRRMSSI